MYHQFAFAFIHNTQQNTQAGDHRIIITPATITTIHPLDFHGAIPQTTIITTIAAMASASAIPTIHPQAGAPPQIITITIRVRGALAIQTITTTAAMHGAAAPI